MLGWIGSRPEAGDTKEDRKSIESHPQKVSRKAAWV